MYVVLLGPPGSGKGTQGSIIAEQLRISHLSTGDLFREILQNPSHPLYPQVQVVDEGKLVSDDVVNLVVEDGIRKPEYRNGVIFDGYPRTIAQARALDCMLAAMDKKVDLVLDLDVTQDVLLFRILGRQVCPKCKKVFHERQGFKNCPDCGGPLVRRNDDNEETILQRLEEYRKKTAPLQEYYSKSKAVYIKLYIDDASKTAEDVNKEILELMKQNNVLYEVV
ncbi:MAG TPA: adenylate kinase [Clostridiales bacterium]|nr:adenylate kinase [Clostridiales bacterium]